MSAEAVAITAVIDEGAPALRTLYANGVSINDFPVYQEEFEWIEKRLGRKKPLNRRVFVQRFADFEFLKVDSPVADVAHELREERAFEAVTALIATLSEQLERDNALDLAVLAREKLSHIQRQHVLSSEVDLDDWQHTIREMKQGMILANQGMTAGIPTGISYLDEHWGGLMPGVFAEILGKTGEGKSYLMMILALACRLASRNVGFFSPEMNEHEVKCRYHTLASANPNIQKALGLERSFRNKNLMQRRCFNLKTYQEFCRYMQEEVPGRMHLLSGSGRMEQMGVGYIEDRIVELALDVVFVDPIYLLRPVRTSPDGNEYQEIAWIAESLHRLSETYNIPIVFSNQSHLTGGASEDAPHKSMGFGTKKMMHLADYILGVKNISDEGRMLFRGSKSRFGEEFRFEARFDANTGLFRVVTPLGARSMSKNGVDPDEEEVQKLIGQKGKAVKKGKAK